MSALDPLTIQGTRLTWLPDGMNWRGYWDSTAQYVKNDVAMSQIDNAAYVAIRNVLGGQDPSFVLLGGPWIRLSPGMEDATQQIGAITTFSQGAAYGNGVIFTRLLNNVNVPAYFTLPATIRDNHAVIMMIVSGPVMYSQSKVISGLAVGPYDPATTHPPYPATYPNCGTIPKTTYTRGAAAPGPLTCYVSQVKFLYVNAAAPEYLASYNIPPLTSDVPLDPILPTEAEIIGFNPPTAPLPPYLQWASIPYDGYQAAYTPTMVFILRRGVDYNGNTAQLGLGYAAVFGDAALNSVGGLGYSCDFVGLV